MKLYFDTCCYNRPFDDQRQPRIRAEADAVKKIVSLSRRYGYTVFSSKALDLELGKIKDVEIYEEVRGFYNRAATAHATARDAVFAHFGPLAERAGIGATDAAHLCYAISAGADYLLTTDDDFIKIAAGLALPVRVINPLNFQLGGAGW